MEKGFSVLGEEEEGGGGREGFLGGREVIGSRRPGRVEEEKKEKSGWVRVFSKGAFFRSRVFIGLNWIGWEVDRGGEFWGE